MTKVIPSKILAAGSSKGFSFLPGVNRPVKPAHVTKIAQSINAMGNLRAVIVATVSFIVCKLKVFYCFNYEIASSKTV